MQAPIVNQQQMNFQQVQQPQQQQFVQQNNNVINDMDMDVDSADADDPSAVSEYVGQIYDHFRRTEVSKYMMYIIMAQIFVG